MRKAVGRLALGLLALCGTSAPAHAYFLDKGRNFDVRGRFYSQLGIMMEDASDEAPTDYHLGDLAQHRNFYNPEFDARLTDYTRWMRDTPGLRHVAPDGLKFRFAWWGFYDGIYDYLDPEWNDARKSYRARFSETDRIAKSLVFNDQNKNPRHIYASRNRINELYVDYEKDRFFFRIGRQAISWGEADTIAILDVSNPFDLTLGAPGFFQDVDEARIPLWTGRATVKLIDQWRWLSSLFFDGYVVPGPIDTTVPINPITAGVSPFNPDVRDPQEQVEAIAGSLASGVHTIVVDRHPEQKWANTRWGARLTSVVARDYTVQGWFFRTFNQQPTFLLHSPASLQLQIDGKLKPTLIDDRGFRVPSCTNGRAPSGRPCKAAVPAINILERRLESVVGLSATWFNQMLNGIIRTELEYFIDEAGFIPEKNLNAVAQLPTAAALAVGRQPGSTSLPTANFLRFLIGYDRFFFLRALNPTNSFLVSTSFNGSINLDEDDHHDYTYPNPKPGKPAAASGPIPGTLCRGAAARTNPLCVQTIPGNFEDLNKFEGFLQTAFQTDYMHGKLAPRVIIITDVSGIFGFAPSVTYRVTDSFLVSGAYFAIAASREAGLGTFRDHDMLQLRLTYQLN
jgi:hypothetical protein